MGLEERAEDFTEGDVEHVLILFVVCVVFSLVIAVGFSGLLCPLTLLEGNAQQANDDASGLIDFLLCEELNLNR
ncbi:MAG: hypothetical protein V2I33_21865, partial [Kangiellaceae bacterium]|nr:hypothetical protein [Kangiellaceae bacterium]